MISLKDTTIPYRQIRALYDEDTVTVYQAYSDEIGKAAVQHQKLSASTAFRYQRMTWIKPSWCWMMYRSGYSFKDMRQSCILAIKMRHTDFQHLLSSACVTHGSSGKLSDADRQKSIRIQWDPERTPQLDVLPYRSIQIGIGKEMSEKWVNEMIVSIEDVTERARAMKDTLENEPRLELDEAIRRGLMPVEIPYKVSMELREVLKIDEESARGMIRCE